MKTISEIKKEQSEKYGENITKCGMFFAFSNDQFEQNKTPLKDGDKYVHIGAGGYLPKSNVDLWLDGCDKVRQWYKEETKNAKIRRQNIAYELSNHEAYYTGDIEDSLNALGSDYTREEVLEVYRKEKLKCTDY